jgi:L-alanine-DL-glutamate epimerase-like enolase superfamily enzyme
VVEEPVSSDDLDGLRLLRDRAPAGMEIAAGEYGYDLGYFRRMLAAGAVDVLQADATRCGGLPAS